MSRDAPAPADQQVVLRLYVAGSTVRSKQAINSVRELCRTRLEGRYKLEVVDIRDEPWRAEEANIMATPALVRELPDQLRKAIGDMADHETVVMALELDAEPPDRR